MNIFDTFPTLRDELRADTRGPLTLVLSPTTAFILGVLLDEMQATESIEPEIALAATTVLAHLRAYFADAPTVQQLLEQP